MCVVAIAWNADPRWRLVVAGNRDEFHARPSAALARWDDAPHIIGGRDLLSGGSWLGVSDQGRFAVVTNHAGGSDPNPGKASRGGLIAGFLANGMIDEGRLDQFNPFNLMVAETGRARILTNIGSPQVSPLSAGITSLSNGIAAIHSARQEALELALMRWLESGAPLDHLLAPLRDPQPLGGPEVRPVFIDGAEYGTRCSTVMAIDHEGLGRIIERRFGPSAVQTGETEVQFRWPT